MKLSFRLLRQAFILLAIQSSLFGCSAQERPSTEQKAPPPVSSVSAVEREALLRPVKKAFELPAESYLCPNGKLPAKETLQQRFADVFSEQILEDYFSKRRCEVVASSRFGFTPLDTPQAIKQAYVLAFSEPYPAQKDMIVEVRFHPVWGTKQGAEGGAIVYLKKLKAGWRISNIESVEQLGANGFQSLVQGYPSASSDSWADMDYTKSLSFPAPKK